MPVIPALRTKRKEDQRFKFILRGISSWRPVKATWNSESTANRNSFIRINYKR